MTDTPLKPLTPIAVFWTVFLALWAFAISAAVLVGLVWFVAKFLIL
jgi:hypothetical protein